MEACADKYKRKWTTEPFQQFSHKKRVNRNPADIGDLKNGFVSKIITLDLLVTSRNLSNYAMIPLAHLPSKENASRLTRKC